MLTLYQLTQYVEAGLNEHPVHGGLYVGCVPARDQEVVTGWDHTEQAQTHKHQSSYRPENLEHKAITFFQLFLITLYVFTNFLPSYLYAAVVNLSIMVMVMVPMPRTLMMIM